MFQTKGKMAMLADELFSMGSRKSELFVDSGNVNCPSNHRDISIEYCFECPFLVDSNLNGERASIVCQR
jgi:hypothetical protein